MSLAKPIIELLKPYSLEVKKEVYESLKIEIEKSETKSKPLVKRNLTVRH